MTTRLLAGPALRFQPDGRLVSLVRDGYESAFEEIFRRYGAALRSYAASIVTTQRADDVTQEAFTKAYLALRGSDKEIQLRPWLYRIVRNTALTDIRDQPRAGVELDEARAAGMSPEELAEQREEIKGLMAGLRELPEPQRAAIVMRELEGLSHEQIATSLGLSGGAVRQSIYRARRALREGLGMLLPMPVLRVLLDEAFAQGTSAVAAGGGAGIAVKTGMVALLAAGTVTTGAVLNHELKTTPDADAKSARAQSASSRGGRSVVAERGSVTGRGRAGTEAGDDRRGGGRRGSDDGVSRHRSDSSGPGGGGSGTGFGGRDGSGSNSGSGDSGSGSSGTSGSGTSSSGSSGPGPDGSGSGDLSGMDGSGSGSSGPSSVDSGRDGGSDDPLPQLVQASTAG